MEHIQTQDMSGGSLSVESCLQNVVWGGRSRVVRGIAVTAAQRRLALEESRAPGVTSDSALIQSD